MKMFVFWFELNFVAKGPIDTMWASVQVMAWHRPGDKPLSNADPVHWRIYAALGGDEFSSNLAK